MYSTPTLKQQINPSPLERVDMHVGRDVAYLMPKRRGRVHPWSPIYIYTYISIYLYIYICMYIILV